MPHRSPRLAPPFRVLLVLGVLPAFALAQDATSDRVAGRYCLDDSLALRSAAWQQALCLDLPRADLPGADLPPLLDLVESSTHPR